MTFYVIFAHGVGRMNAIAKVYFCVEFSYKPSDYFTKSGEGRKPKNGEMHKKDTFLKTFYAFWVVIRSISPKLTS